LLLNAQSSGSELYFAWLKSGLESDSSASLYGRGTRLVRVRRQSSEMHGRTTTVQRVRAAV